MIRQIVAFVENRKGIIWHLTTVLREEGIHICGLSTVDSPEFGIVRMLVDAPKAAADALAKAGFVVKECEVIAVEMNAPDEMDSLLQVIQDGNVNINYFYSSFGSSGNRPILILHAADMDETEAMLENRGFSCLDTCSRL
ncbi:MAG: amino acid-binding protein [Lachnospiraceae bacterium]|nr:amino acid-binding protein [Lachnospiraceae bacterium]